MAESCVIAERLLLSTRFALSCVVVILVEQTRYEVEVPRILANAIYSSLLVRRVALKLISGPNPGGKSPRSSAPGLGALQRTASPN